MGVAVYLSSAYLRLSPDVMELKLRLPEVAVEAKAVEAIADLFRPRMRACLACLLAVAYVLSRLHCAKWGVNAIGNRLLHLLLSALHSLHIFLASVAGGSFTFLTYYKICELGMLLKLQQYNRLVHGSQTELGGVYVTLSRATAS